MLQKYLSKESVVPYLVPFLVFMIITSCESLLTGENRQLYPLVYLIKIILTAVSLVWVFPVLKTYLRRLSAWAIPVGLLGGVVWIGLCQVPQLNPNVWLPTNVSSALESILPSAGARTAFNPFAEFSTNPAMAWCWWSVRLIGLVLIVPIIEEWFLRGFLMRIVCDQKIDNKNWYDLPIGTTTAIVWGIAVLYPILTHPELVAGVVWFCLITALAMKTKSLVDCIAAHAVTNLTMGLWVLVSGQWALM